MDTTTQEKALAAEIQELNIALQGGNLTGEQRAIMHEEIVALQLELETLQNQRTRSELSSLLPIAIALAGGYYAMKRTKDVPVTIAATYGAYSFLKQII